MIELWELLTGAVRASYHTLPLHIHTPAVIRSFDWGPW